MVSLSIGKLAARTRVKVTTIRYYESIGLLEEPVRSASGQRAYCNSDLERLSFIRHARDLGFSIEEIRELISLQVNVNQDCEVVDQIASGQLDKVRRRLAQLEALEGELRRILTSCEGGTVGTCNILEALKDHEQCNYASHDGDEILSVPPSKRS